MKECQFYVYPDAFIEPCLSIDCQQMNNNTEVSVLINCATKGARYTGTKLSSKLMDKGTVVHFCLLPLCKGCHASIKVSSGPQLAPSAAQLVTMLT